MSSKSRSFRPGSPAWLGIALAFLGAPQFGWGSEPSAIGKVDALRIRFADLAERSEKRGTSVVGGEAGWLFVAGDVRFCSLGPFWGESAAAVSRSRKPEHADPLQAILDFKAQLDRQGIELWLLPVPPKPAIEVGRLFERPAADIRCDAAVAEFLEELRRREVLVVDLEPAFRETAGAGGPSMYCQTDSHWSGAGIRAAAAELGRVLRRRAWSNAPDRSGTTEQSSEDCRETERKLTLKGDLRGLPATPAAGFASAAVPETETLSVWNVVEVATGRPPVTNERARVLLLGDSHTLFLHDPQLHGPGAGLPEHLRLQLGEPIDVIGVRGSGSTSARITLARSKDRLRGKTAVIWCFAAREFTESLDGWRKVEVRRTKTD